MTCVLAYVIFLLYLCSRKGWRTQQITVGIEKTLLRTVEIEAGSAGNSEHDKPPKYLRKTSDILSRGLSTCCLRVY